MEHAVKSTIRKCAEIPHIALYRLQCQPVALSNLTIELKLLI